METPTNPEPAAPAKPKTLSQRFAFFNTRRGRLLINIGCIPTVLLCTLATVGFFSVLLFFRVPSGVIDKQTYVAGGRLGLGVIATVGLQTLATWALGIIAALFGLRAVAGQGAYVMRRLGVIWRRLVIGAWAVIALRLAFLVVVVLGAIQIYTTFFGFRLSWDTADEFASFLTHYPILVVLSVLILLGQWLIGPLLRLRFSLALGMLGGAWAEDRDQRPWLALTLRLGTELAGVVGMMWTLMVARILLGILFRDVSSYSSFQYPDLFPALPPRAASLATLIVFTALVMLIHTVLQVVSTQWALGTVRRRLARPKPVTFYSKTGEFFREVVRATAAKGQAT